MATTASVVGLPNALGLSSAMLATSRSTMQPMQLRDYSMQTCGSRCETLATLKFNFSERQGRKSSRALMATSLQAYRLVGRKNFRIELQSRRIRSLKSVSTTHVLGHGHEEYLQASKANSTMDGSVHRNDGAILATISHDQFPSPSPTMFEEKEKSIGGTNYNMPLERGEETQPSVIKPFVWKNNWYPVFPEEDLDPSVPTPVTLLGRELVLWRDGDKIWRAFLDECPHRLAPLSEGRVNEKGQLQCTYHGWAFKGNGTCGGIPQATSEGPEANAQFSPRACAVSFPTQVSQGLLFVWPDEHGWEMASTTEPQKLPSDFEDPDNFCQTYVREVSYDYTVSMENILDPAHPFFAHHKVAGRREDATPMPLKLGSSVGPWGFAGNDKPWLEVEFHAPCFVFSRVQYVMTVPIFGEFKVQQNHCLFEVPVAPGVVRVISTIYRTILGSNQKPIAAVWGKLYPRWLEHLVQNDILDGDLVLLVGQEHTLLKKGIETESEQYSKITFTPTSSDRFVLAFRNWLHRYGGGKVEWAPTSKPRQLVNMTRREMLDRFNSHTSKCASCTKALESSRFWQKVFAGHAVVMGLAAISGLPFALPLRLLIATGATINVLLAYALKHGEKYFIFKDYVHAKI